MDMYITNDGIKGNKVKMRKIKKNKKYCF